MKIKQLAVFIILLTSISLSYATTIKIATIAPDGSSWMNIMNKVAQKINHKTQGRVDFKFYPGGIMGSDSSIIRKMRVNQLQGGAIAISSLQDLTKSTLIYSLPFTFNNMDEVFHIRNKYDSIIRKELKTKGLELLGVSNGGFAHLMSTLPIKNIEDLRRARAWLPETGFLDQAVFEQANIKPILLPVADVYTSLQTGLINTIAINPSSAIILQWYSKINYIVDLPLNVITGVLVVSSKALDKLNKKDAQIVREEFDLAFEQIDKNNVKDELKAKKALKAGGLVFIKPDEKVVQEFKTYSKLAREKFTENQYPKALYLELLQDLKQYRKNK